MFHGETFKKGLFIYCCTAQNVSTYFLLYQFVFKENADQVKWKSPFWKDSVI